MKRVCLVLFAVLLISSTGLMAQIRKEKPNDFTFDLGGRCLLYSMSYQRVISEVFGLEIGVSYLGGGGDGVSGGVFFLSGGGRLYLMKKNASPTLSGGIVYVTGGTDAGPFDEDSESGVYFYASPGFEFRMSNGFVFRGGVYFLIKNAFVVWPGIQLGIAF